MSPTKGLISSKMALHERYKSWCIYLAFSGKVRRKIAKLYFSNSRLFYIFRFELAMTVLDKLNDSILSRGSLLTINSFFNRRFPRLRRLGCFNSLEFLSELSPYYFHKQLWIQGKITITRFGLAGERGREGWGRLRSRTFLTINRPF